MLKATINKRHKWKKKRSRIKTKLLKGSKPRLVVYRSNKNDAFKKYPRENHRYKLGEEIILETYLSIILIPFEPVCALALPELTINTLHFPLLYFLSHMIGAEGVDVSEYTQLTLITFSNTITNRSLFLSLKILSL